MKSDNHPLNHVVLTDDDADDRNFFHEAFRELEFGCNLHTFADGSELMDFLNSTKLTPDVLILDLNMPRKSGFECIEEIRSNKRFRNMSIAVYSTSSSDLDIDDTFRRGANLYIKKPSDYGKLKKMIQSVLTTDWSLHHSGRSKERYLLHL